MIELNAYGGALSGDWPLYIKRREDREVFNRLAHGQVCYVLTSHQMGKSSLVVRLRERFRHNGISAAAIDLAAIGRELNASQWYDALCLRVGQELHLEEEFETFLDAHKNLAPFDRFYRALDCIALRALSHPLILFVDELDLVRSLPFSPDEFLGAIHSAAARSAGDGSELNRLVFCSFATVTPSALWREAKPGHSDLGCIIGLQDFQRSELFQVIDGLALFLLEKNEPSVSPCLSQTKFVLGEILDRVFHWTHGHPYLTQKLAGVATHCISPQLGHAAEITPVQCRQFVDSILEKLFTNPIARDQDCHLLWIGQKLLHCGLDPARLVNLLQRVPHGIPVDLLEDHESQLLINSGVVCLRDGFLQVRNRIYARLFDEGWLSTRPRARGVPTRAPLGQGAALFTRQCSSLPLPAAVAG